jgi:hypothetical protein
LIFVLVSNILVKVWVNIYRKIKYREVKYSE